jgi:RND family efflux transporter MFP subunit
MTSSRKFITLYICTLILAFTVACDRGSSAKAGAGGPGGPGGAMPVKTQTVESKKVPDYTEYIATLQARGSAILQPEVEGQITKILVHSGEHVKAGQTLLMIDPRRQEATVNSQEASLRTKQATLEFDRLDLERKQRLFREGVIARQDLDQSQTAYDAAKADLEATAAGVRQQSVQLRYYTVTAPHDGTVGDIPVRVGDRVQNTTPLTTIDGGGPLEAYISIPAENANRVKPGTPVDILKENGEVALRTKVTFISPRVDTTNQLLLIKAEVPNSKGLFRNYQLVHAHVIWNEAEHVVAPVNAVARLGNLNFAYVAEQQGQTTVAKQRRISTGDINGNDYVVLDGLTPGDKLIVTAVQTLVDGMPVKPE